jgi:ubiquinone/menaquinone biosynthesis C-methylase UbiE
MTTDLGPSVTAPPVAALIRTPHMEVSAEYTIRDQERMQRASRYFTWQASLATRHLGRRVLEVGCGMGNFTSHLLARDAVVGLDVVDECLAQHRQRFAGHAGIESLQLDILDPRVLNLQTRRFDSIACLNVLEHISDDAQALRHMHALLPRGGRAVFIVPAFPSLYGPIDTNLGHYRRYSKASWKRLTDAIGFRQVITRYMNVVGFFGWWFNAKILKKQEQSETQIAVFDSVLVPIFSRAEGLLEPPFGQSIFAVLERQ